MGIEPDLVAVLEDLVQFLESLSDIDLPNDMQNLRLTLLRRSRTSLTAVVQRSTTPEPYLDMNAGIGKGLHLMKKINYSDVTNDNQITEYMYADNSNQSKFSSCQDHYETFPANNPNEYVIENDSTNTEQGIKSIYETFSYGQTLSKATKAGPLNLKEERRLFRFHFFGGMDQFRSCFIGLVGTHLLLYTTKHDKHPFEIISILGYSARASPNAIPRDLERSKSAFEIFSPGNRTFQFAARSPKEMEQWVAMIGRAGNTAPSFLNTEPMMTNLMPIKESTETGVPLPTACPEEQYQDVGHINDAVTSQSTNDKKNDTDNAVTLRNEEKLTYIMSLDNVPNPPPLPARIPRRLPSLPHEQQSPKLDVIDDVFDEDDIYHKIEDVRQLVNTYQNLTCPNHVLPTESDPQGSKHNRKKPMKTEKDKNRKISSTLYDLYDDAQPIDVQKVCQVGNEQKSTIYDDIQAIDNNVTKDLNGETRKKSFLDRVRYKKESPKKGNSKKKSNELKPTSNENGVQQQLAPRSPPHGDALHSQLDTQRKEHENLGDYISPPVPRSVHKERASLVAADHHHTEDFYDDIEVFRDRKNDEFSYNSGQVGTSGRSGVNNDYKLSRLAVDSLQMIEKIPICQNEIEHYQVPRPQDSIDIGVQVKMAKPIVEELYDDIAIVANFRARQRDSDNSSRNDRIPSATTNVTRVWNRFASGRKLKVCDTSFEDGGEQHFITESTYKTQKFDSTEEIDGSKMNKLQKLINKMESTLSKPKSTPPMMNKIYNDSSY